MGIPTRYNPLGIRKSEGGYGPQDYLVYFSMTNKPTTIESGQHVSYKGDVTETTNDGIRCLFFSSISSNAELSAEGITGNDNFTISFWFKEYEVVSRRLCIFSYGVERRNTAFAFCIQDNKPGIVGSGDVANEHYGTEIDIYNWHHYLCVRNNGTEYIYIDGIFNTSFTYQRNISRNYIMSINEYLDTNSGANGYYSAIRYYSRALTQTEITTLANELHPLKDITFTNQSLEFNNDEGATSKALSFNAPYSGYKFTINSGTLPDGVTFNTSTGVFTYDGTTILDDEDFTFSITCSGQYMTSATATVTLKMRVEESMPTRDLVIHAPMDSYKVTAETGQAITYTGASSSNFVTFNGIASFNTDNGRYARMTDSSINQGSSLPRSYSVWLAVAGRDTPSNKRGIAIGDFSAGHELCSPNNQPYYSSYHIQAGGHSRDYETSRSLIPGEWIHYVQTFSADGTLKLYLNGVLMLTHANTDIDINNYIMSLGAPTTSTNDYFKGYIAGARLYNCELTQEEVTRLATEYTPQYTITANDLNCNFYQKNETFGITYSSAMTPSFEIIEGSLPNTITFNTTNGQFSGKGLTDDDHIYNLKVRITAAQSTPAECNVTIHTYKTARISITGKTFTFYTDGSENSTFEYTSDEAVTFAVDSGSLPNGITMNGNTFYSDGTTTAGTYSVVVRGTSEHNQTGVTATMNFTINANVITIGTSSLKFFVDKGTTTKQIKYTTSKHAITPVYSMTGTLPNGVTFDASTGTFTNDATQTAATSGTVSVTVSSSTGLSTSATKSIDLIVEMVSPAIPEEDLVVYAPMTDLSDTTATGQSINVYNITTATVQGIECLYGDKYSLNSNYFISYSDDNLYGSSSRTFSFWAMLDNVHDTGTHTLFCIGRYPPINKWWRQTIFGLQTDSNNADGISISNATYQDVENKWVFVSSRYNHDSKTLKYEIYIPETNKWFRCSKDQTNYMNTSNNGRLRIWNEEWDARPAFWATAFRAYSRYLDDFEIQQLAAEFTPTDG